MKISLLIVEDDQEAIGIICSIVGKKMPEVAVHVAENGKRGLELYKELSPQIVITDVNMPEMDGVTMAGEIRAISRDTKLIVLTGYSDRAADFRDLGVEHYFVKPVNMRSLLAALQACVVELQTEE